MTKKRIRLEWNDRRRRRVPHLYALMRSSEADQRGDGAFDGGDGRDDAHSDRTLPMFHVVFDHDDLAYIAIDVGDGWGGGREKFELHHEVDPGYSRQAVVR